MVITFAVEIWPADAERFDALVRTLTRTGSCRALTKVLAVLSLGGALGTAGMTVVTAKNKHNNGNKKKA